MVSTPTSGPTDAAGHEVSADERQAARARRERLFHALVALESALTGPSQPHERWLAEVREAVTEMRDTVVDHVAESEAPDGLLAQISEVSPWLGPKVVALRAEHDELVAAAERLVLACAAATDPGQVADDGWALLGQVSRHRSRGADLLYDAYALDVSAGD
jgi:hypothetical protein